MKKVILIFLAAIAFSCGGGSGSNEAARNTDTEDNSNYSDDALEADTTDMRMDTTSTPSMDQGYDDQSTEQDTSSINSSNP